MRTNSNTVIPPTTSAASATISLGHDDIPARLVAHGLAGSETCALLAVDGELGDVETVVYKDDEPDKLTATRTASAIIAPGVYKLNKSPTAGAAGVYLTKACWV